jgi:hypothetical protein
MQHITPSTIQKLVWNDKKVGKLQFCLEKSVYYLKGTNLSSIHAVICILLHNSFNNDFDSRIERPSQVPAILSFQKGTSLYISPMMIVSYKF